MQKKYVFSTYQANQHILNNMTVQFPVAPIDIKKVVEEFERKLGVSFNQDKYGVGISNANKNLLIWKYWQMDVSIVHCYKAVNIDYAKDIKQALVERGALPLPNDIIVDDVYVEKPLFIFLRNLRVGESTEVEYES